MKCISRNFFSLRVFYQSLESLYNHHQMSVKRKVRICFEKEKKIDRLDVVVFFFSMAGATDGHHHHEDPRKMEETQKATSSLCHFPLCVSLWRCDGAIRKKRSSTNRHITQRRAFVPAAFPSPESIKKCVALLFSY